MMTWSSSGPTDPSYSTAFFERSTTISVESLHLNDSARKKYLNWETEDR